MTKFTYIPIFLFLLTSSVIGQESTNKRLEWIKQLSEFRDYLMLYNPEGTLEVKSLLKKWNKIESENRKKKNFKQEISLISRQKDISHKELITHLKNKFSCSKKLAKKSTEDDVRIIKENSKLLDMIFWGLLNSEYPFTLNKNSDVFSELEEYEIKNDDKIGEIGAGEGAFSLIIHTLSPQTKLYINELQLGYLEILASHMEQDLRIYDLENIKLMHGNRSSIGMEGYNLDKIIIRNSFHHFNDKVAMLKSIKASLDKNGILYLVEATRDLNKGKKKCNQTLKSKEIIKTVESAQFELLKQVQVGGNTMMKFQHSVKTID